MDSESRYYARWGIILALVALMTGGIAAVLQGLPTPPANVPASWYGGLWVWATTNRTPILIVLLLVCLVSLFGLLGLGAWWTIEWWLRRRRAKREKAEPPEPSSPDLPESELGFDIDEPDAISEKPRWGLAVYAGATPVIGCEARATLYELGHGGSMLRGKPDLLRWYPPAANGEDKSADIPAHGRRALTLVQRDFGTLIFRFAPDAYYASIEHTQGYGMRIELWDSIITVEIRPDPTDAANLLVTEEHELNAQKGA